MCRMIVFEIALRTFMNKMKYNKYDCCLLVFLTPKIRIRIINYGQIYITFILLILYKSNKVYLRKNKKCLQKLKDLKNADQIANIYTIQIKQMKNKQEVVSQSPLQKYVRPGLNLHAIEEIKSIFDLFDTHKTGRVNPKDLKDTLSHQGKQVENQTIYQLICDMDAEGKGSIDFQAFIFFLNPNVTGVEPEDELRKLFTLFDDTKTGFIGAPTLRRICKSLNLHIQDKQIQQMIAYADRDKDGLISFQEFSQMLAFRPQMN